MQNLDQKKKQKMNPTRRNQLAQELDETRGSSISDKSKITYSYNVTTFIHWMIQNCPDSIDSEFIAEMPLQESVREVKKAIRERILRPNSRFAFDETKFEVEMFFLFLSDMK